MRTILRASPFVLCACVQSLPLDPSDDDTVQTDDTDTDTGPMIDDVESRVHDEIGSIIEVSWNQTEEVPVWVSYRFDDDLWVQSPEAGGASGAHSMLLLGIPYGSTVEYRLNWEDENGIRETETRTTENDPLPDHIPLPISVDMNEDAIDSQANYIFTSMNADGTNEEYVVFIMDRRGRVVWAWDLPRFRLSLHPRLSHDGSDLLVDFNSFWYLYDGGSGSRVQRMNIDGSIDELYDTPGLHHPFTELPDGSIVYGFNQAIDTGDWLYESLVQLTPEGEYIELFECRQYFQSLGVTEQCGSNTIFYDTERNVFLYSLYSVDSILEIDAETGDVLEVYGNLPGAWSFDPEDANFYWQHGINVLDDGNFLLSCHPEGESPVLQVREYERDADTETLNQVWHFGENGDVVGETMGEAHRLSNGNTLHNYGSNSRLREITPEGEIVWDVQWEQELIGRSEPIANLYDLMP